MSKVHLNAPLLHSTIVAWVISFLILSYYNQTLGYDFQYEYIPFTKGQIYTIEAKDDNGIIREYDVVGIINYRYTTERDNPDLNQEDLRKFISVLNELNIDLTNNHHIIQTEPINPISLQSGGLILPAVAKYYRYTATCNALRLKKPLSKWKQWLIDWLNK